MGAFVCFYVRGGNGGIDLCVSPPPPFWQANNLCLPKAHAVYFVSPFVCLYYSILKDKLIGYLYVRMLKVVAALCGREKQMRLKCTSFPSSKVTVMYIFLMKFRNKTCCSCIISFKMLLLLSLV